MPIPKKCSIARSYFMNKRKSHMGAEQVRERGLGLKL